MDNFLRLSSITRPDFERHIRDNPLLHKLNGGQATKDQYVVYLREMYHLVRHTSRVLALAAARLNDDQRGLRHWLLEQANEEHGHELFCQKDIKNLGLDVKTVTDSFPAPGAWSFISQNYYMADHGEPRAILGVASATEVMGASMAGPTADVLNQHYGIPESATTFLRSHAGFDKRHLQEVQEAINSFCDSEEIFDQVVFARRMSFRALGQLFQDVANSEERFFYKGAHNAA